MNVDIRKAQYEALKAQGENVKNNHLTDYFNEIYEDLEKLTLQRYSQDELTQKVSKIVGTDVKLQGVHSSGLTEDFAFIVGVFPDYGYIDLYYAKTYSESSLILTEIALTAE